MLNDRQRRFVAEYLADLNATRAAIRAGYSASSARQVAGRMMTSPPRSPMRRPRATAGRR